MQTLSESDNISLMTRMLDNGYFPFIYNENEIKIGKEDFSEPGLTVYNFSCNKIVVVGLKSIYKISEFPVNLI